MSLLDTVLFAIPAWFAYRLARDPGNRALRAILVCLLLRMADSTLLMSALRSALRLSPAAEKLLKNYALAASWLFLMLFFVFAAGQTARKASREAALLLAVLVTMTVLILLSPTPLADPTANPLAVSHEPRALLLYVVGNAYYGYATAQAAWWARRYAVESSRRTRLGLLIAAFGLALNATACFVRTAIVLLPEVPSGATYVANMLIGIGLSLFALGVCLAGFIARVAALRVWLRHLRLYHELGPLWRLLHESFPGDALDRQPRGLWRDRITPRRVHRRYWRRIVECRDGLVRLSPHLADIAGPDSEPPMRVSGTQLREALQRHAEGVRPSSSSAVLVAAPAASADVDDEDADIDELVRLSRSLPVTETESTTAAPSAETG